MVGYQRYRPDSTAKKVNDPREGRYFTRVKEKRVGVWGLESWNFSNTLFVTEGVFDACGITHNGYSAISVLSYSLSDTAKNWLWAVRQTRPVVCVCDNDDSGRKLAKYGHDSHVVVGYDDLADAPDEYVLKMIKEYDG